MPTHLPVMADRCLELLGLGAEAEPNRAIAQAAPGRRPVIIDATLGLGGHSEAILAAADVTVIGIDRDATAIAHASVRLAKFGDRFQAVHTTYDNIAEVAAAHGGAAGILMDLGVSSMQLDEAQRGFSYTRDAALDMRMNQDAGMSAAEYLARVDARELERVLRAYGEEKAARRLAQAIIAHRQSEPIATTAQLVAIIDAAMPAPARRSGGHPAKRTFQAIRIAVNDELQILAAALPAAIDALLPGGRLVVESYHSLEDRLVKQAMRAVTSSDLPAHLPVTAAMAQTNFRSLTRGAEKASAAEIETNPRAQSVRIRAIERVK